MFYFQGSVEGRRTSELKDFAGCLRGERTPPPEHNDGVDRADDRKKEENVDQSKYNFSACTCLHSHVLNL